MKALKLRMYSSLIFGKLAVLTGLYLFTNNSDKTTGRFVILIGLSSIIIGSYIFFTTRKREPKQGA